MMGNYLLFFHFKVPEPCTSDLATLIWEIKLVPTSSKEHGTWVHSSTTTPWMATSPLLSWIQRFHLVTQSRPYKSLRLGVTCPVEQKCLLAAGAPPHVSHLGVGVGSVESEMATSHQTIWNVTNTGIVPFCHFVHLRASAWQTALLRCSLPSKFLC